MTRALVAGKQKNGGPPVSGFEDMCIGFREVLGDHSLENRGHFLRLTEKVKETFDDAPDSGAGRTTVFLFPSEVEAERRQAAGLTPTDPPTAKPAGPLAGLEEVDG